jgi:hypothetical protein
LVLVDFSSLRKMPKYGGLAKKSANPKTMVINMPPSGYGSYGNANYFQNTPKTSSYQYLPTKGVQKRLGLHKAGKRR